MRTRALLISLLALSTPGPLLVAGCGGDDSTGAATTTDPALTQPADEPAGTTEPAPGGGATGSEAEGDGSATAPEAGDEPGADGGDGGADPSRAYARAVRTELARFTVEARSIGSQLLGASDPAGFQRLMEEGQANISTAIEGLEALQPPAGTEAGHDELIAAFEAFSSDLTEVADGASAGGAGGPAAAAAQLQAAARAFTERLGGALQELGSAGVEVGPAGLG